MRSILVFADSSPAMETRLQAGLDIARACSGHLSLLTCLPANRFVTIDPFGGSYLAEGAFAEAQARDAALAETLAQRMAGEDVPWSIYASDREPVDALVGAARLADMVIVSNPGFDAPSPFAPDVSALATATSAPVLALPQDGPAFAPSAPALVAWNGSHEAAHALKSAVPLLKLASSVALLSVAPAKGADESGAGEAMAYLSRHGVSAELVERTADRLTPEEVIHAAAADAGAGLVVMGAYGHSRLREFLVGGVTRYMVGNAAFNLLLMH